MTTTKTIELAMYAPDGSKRKVSVPVKSQGKTLAIHRPVPLREGEAPVGWALTHKASGLRVISAPHLAPLRMILKRLDSEPAFAKANPTHADLKPLSFLVRRMRAWIDLGDYSRGVTWTGTPMEFDKGGLTKAGSV